jgi:hypothetical protein
MFPEKLTCPACGNTTHFREIALRYTAQEFTVADGSYEDAEWDRYDVVGEDNFPVEILCNSEACRTRSPLEETVVWRHPNVEAAERLLDATTPARPERR